MTKPYFLKLHGNTYEPTQFLFVWKEENRSHCQCLYCKDYETAQYISLQLIKDKGYKNVVLYKSGIKLNKTDKSYMYRVYVPVAYYNGNLYELERVKEFYGTAIEIWTDDRRNWSANYEDYEECYEELRAAIEDNAKRVYGKNWRVEK
nr:MAG: hypothetical protein [Bacteriophage sp.]